MLINKQKTVVLPRVEPIVTEGVLMAIRVKYSEPKVNQ